MEHVVQTILKDTCVDSSIFVDELELGSVDGVVGVGENVSVVRGSYSASSHQVIDNIGVVKVGSEDKGLHGKKLCDHGAHHGGIHGQAESMLTIDGLARVYGNVDIEAIESWILRNRVAEEKSDIGLCIICQYTL